MLSWRRKIKEENLLHTLLTSSILQPCEIGAPSFRDVQCAEFNDWVFPEDGKIHRWMAYNLPEGNKR